MNITKLEKLSINAWPSLQTLLCDGWLLRFANGFGRRPNSVNSIFPSLDNDIEKKLNFCETAYTSKGLKPTFKMTNAVSPENLDLLLQDRGYAKEGETLVETLELSSLTTKPSKDLLIENNLTDNWVNYYRIINKIKDSDVSTMTKILLNITLKAQFYTLYKDDRPIAFGLSVIENDYAGLFDIVVDQEYRNKGYGKELLLGILDHLKCNDVQTVYLQVVADNTPALKLYSSLGFVEEYMYWYRVKY